MRSVKIKFIDQWMGFDPESNIFVELLSKRYDVQFSDDPEYLFYSVNGYKHLDYAVPRIFFTQENLTPDFNICDYAFAFDRLSYGDRYFRLPLYLITRRSELLALGSGLRLSHDGERGFCNFVVSNTSPAPERDEFFSLLSRYKRVDSAGFHLNNTGYLVRDKARFQSGYKFSLAFENSSAPGYVTEKIVDAAYAGTIPIYWGDPTIGQDFNTASFVNCNDYGSPEEAVRAVIELDQDDEKYGRMVGQNFLKHPLEGYSFQPGFEEFFFSIFDRPWKSAFRRNRYTWGTIYERRLRDFVGAWEKRNRSPIYRMAALYRRLRRLTFRQAIERLRIKLGKILLGQDLEKLQWR
jgi:hypothetical protein